MAKICICFLLVLAIGLAFGGTASPQSPVYYEGKTLRIVVGAARTAYKPRCLSLPITTNMSVQPHHRMGPSVKS